MYSRESLGLEEAKIAVEAMLKEASGEPNRPVAMAVVDSQAQLIYFARMDGGFLLHQEMAVKKASTAVQIGIDTTAFGEYLKAIKVNIADFGCAGITVIQGGVVIVKQDTGVVLGGIGVSGRRAHEDEALARVGLNALKL